MKTTCVYRWADKMFIGGPGHEIGGEHPREIVAAWPGELEDAPAEIKEMMRRVYYGGPWNG